MSAQFRYAPEIKASFPQLKSRILCIEGISPDADPSMEIAGLLAVADKRLELTSEGEFPEIQAWRRAFSAMQLKPTQYRCAAEALLRRYRKEGIIPALHPLIDLCNAVSLAYAIPIAVFDQAYVTTPMIVRYAHGDEVYETFDGLTEFPKAGEVIFSDSMGRAHARRWTHRQSAFSAIRAETAQVLIVAEALHEKAETDIVSLSLTLAKAVQAVWPNAQLLAGSPA
ncbi:hypothetical protein KQ944_13980 [Bacillus subtilis]|uniref:B3/B4 domain-containing protein n=1 Tax=Pseudochrobactrum asaccharolyticum TaxID=354351 RepID=UPI001F328DA3|nr:phenylalanine--tRNA ligase beta subunit-related protein [Pseudochrobactrum asaccharolyticum]MCF7646603.1 hypothetical protein [Pseudochrobactrum asaccharolyticum]MCF7672742.1 hypothetical protein [Bacillus subtilis]